MADDKKKIRKKGKIRKNWKSNKIKKWMNSEGGMQWSWFISNFFSNKQINDWSMDLRKKKKKNQIFTKFWVGWVS